MVAYVKLLDLFLRFLSKSGPCKIPIADRKPNWYLHIGISTAFIDNTQLFILAPDRQYTAASAQAFMQGLYPAVTNLSEVPSSWFQESYLSSNGTYIPMPLNGYQYPEISLVSEDDPKAVFVAGDVNCINYGISQAKYSGDPNAKLLDGSYKQFLQSLGNATLTGECFFFSYF